MHNITMKKEIDPEPEAALKHLVEVHPLIYRALEKGTEHARGYFAANHLTLDPYLFSSIVRYHTRRELIDAQDQSRDLCVRHLQNIGTLIDYRGVQIRLWKASDDGHLPPPGESAAKQAFYHQPYLPGMEEPAGARLAVIWEVDSNLALAEVTLVCPKGSSEPWEAGQEHWRIPLPHPVDTMAAKLFVSPPAGDLDLEIELESSEEKKHG